MRFFPLLPFFAAVSLLLFVAVMSANVTVSPQQSRNCNCSADGKCVCKRYRIVHRFHYTTPAPGKRVLKMVRQTNSSANANSPAAPAPAEQPATQVSTTPPKTSAPPTSPSTEPPSLTPNIIPPLSGPLSILSLLHLPLTQFKADQNMVTFPVPEPFPIPANPTTVPNDPIFNFAFTGTNFPSQPLPPSPSLNNGLNFDQIVDSFKKTFNEMTGGNAQKGFAMQQPPPNNGANFNTGFSDGWNYQNNGMPSGGIAFAATNFNGNQQNGFNGGSQNANGAFDNSQNFAGGFPQLFPGFDNGVASPPQSPDANGNFNVFHNPPLPQQQPPPPPPPVPNFNGFQPFGSGPQTGMYNFEG